MCTDRLAGHTNGNQWAIDQQVIKMETGRSSQQQPVVY